MKTNITIAVVAPQEPFEFFDGFWEGVWSAAYELAPLGVRVLTVSTTSLDVDQQAEALRDAFAEEVQAIVLLPADSKRLNPLIEQHTLRNTPVVTVFNDAPLSRRAAFVGADFHLAGRLAGELMSKVIPARSHILALTGFREALYLTRRYEGFRQALEASKVSFGITELNDPELFASVLSGRGAKFDGLYIGCSETADIRAILEQVRSPARCVTFDLTDAVKPFLQTGIVAAVVDSSRYHQGYIAVQKAYECLQTSSVEAAWVPIPSSVLLPAHASTAGACSSSTAMFETLVRQRTVQLSHYKEALESANVRLMRMAETDPLTDLLNRRKFEEALASGMERADLDRESLSLLLVDIDDFRSLNDVLGRATGDQALCILADTLRAGCRKGEVIARLGGDEFALVLPGADRAGAEQVRERLDSAVRECRLPGHPDLRLTVSIGCASLTSDTPTVADLMSYAERSLGQSKRSHLRATNLKILPRTG